MNKKLLILYVLLIASTSLFGQNHLVRGIVFDSDSLPMVGVSILEKGTLNGTVTDVDGNYELAVSSKDAVITFSFIGFQKTEKNLNGNSILNVKLFEAVIGLDELVVVGYGTQKKESLTGAISTVKGQEMAKTTAMDVSNTLTGRAAGVRVVQLSSEPGAYDTQIDIRGFGDPLFIIDGVEQDKAVFSRLNPNEIESVSVLKDGSAAIYGVQAANGVILVETKRGEEGSIKVGYSGKFGMNTITQYPRLSNAYQYSVLKTESQVNQKISAHQLDNITTTYTPEEVEMYRTGELPSTNYLDLILDDRAKQQNHNMSIRGGSKDIKYFSSFGFFTEDGLWSSGDLSAQKINYRSNIDAKLSRSLTLTANLGYINSRSDKQRHSNMDILRSAWRMNPAENAYANNNEAYIAEYKHMPGRTNPVSLIYSENTGFVKTENQYIQSKFDLRYVVPGIKGLSSKFTYAYNLSSSRNRVFTKTWDQYLFDENTENYVPYVHGGPNSFSEARAREAKEGLRFAINYKRNFKGHDLNALLVAEQQKTKYDYISGSTQLILVSPDLNSGEAKKEDVSSRFSDRRRRALVGRLNYVFKSKYLAEFSFRYDGSSRFPEGSRWGFFPGISAGWVISEENFIDKESSVLSFLKLRASYGKLGDDGAVQDFAYLQGYRYPSGGYYFGDSHYAGVGIQNSVNEDLTWYVSRTYNIGLDARLWRNLLSVELDVFRKDRRGLLKTRNATLPATYGITLPQENLESDRYKGFEIVLGHHNKIGKARYNISGNISYTRSEYNYIEENPPGNSWDDYYYSKTGRYKGVVLGYVSDGQFQNFEEIYAAPVIDGAGNKSLLPGDIRYKDLNNDGIINEYDRKVIAIDRGKPTIYFGCNFDFNWKNIDFSMLFQGATMHRMKYPEQLSQPLFWGDANPITEFWDRWHREDVFDPNSAWIKGRYPSTGERYNYANSDYWWRDVTYVRLKSVEIGYTFPKSILQKVGVEKLRVFANGYNLFTITNGLDFVDPELNSRDYGYNYPITMNTNLGVQLEF
ncbi:TonB-linked outer membrane protein, SusC/RagA family [Mariniphaga anaerophila]|uniref:TonB-linked outer membrane protein, SusC/RagA family n=1 Tax=Mariniphaga anaerophila TaxID=1484053 RepID=A0A1M5FKP3_9BACT|nr:TonB-dependent receptor [Mariniphaga anaerophila]SHF91721.1 TonB-linked outer membrane protein, SusC/RagA family [Mariniphaga anaerophila]